jgi:hypothetical protein
MLCLGARHNRVKNEPGTALIRAIIFVPDGKLEVEN